MKPESSERPIRASLTAGLFLAALFAVCALWLPQALSVWSRTASPKALFHPVQALENLSATAEADLNKALDRNHLFIQLYGGVQRAAGRRILDDADPHYTVYRLSDGALTFINTTPDPGTAEHAQALLEFIDRMESQGRPVLYLQAPHKVGPPGAPSLPSGVIDYTNDWADAFLAALEAVGADTLDLRAVLAADGETWTSYFFRTDHHWTPDAAFVCWQAVAQVLADRYGLSFPSQAVSQDSFTVTQWDGVFLGSQGKRTGSLYAGFDTLNVWRPDYPTQFTYSVPIEQAEREGPFDETLLFLERLEEDDPFSANPYTLYSGGDYSFTRITNHLNPDGPKIMLLRDSFGCAFAPFLALGCSELTTVDLRYFHDTFLSYVSWVDPDLILLLYSPGSIGREAPFAFFSDDPAAAG